MKTPFFIFLFLPFFLYFGYFPSFLNGQSSGTIARQLLNESGNEISRKYNLQVAGNRIGIPEGNLNLMGITFIVNQPLSIEKARELIIKCADSFLKKINAEERLRNCMVCYPFDYKNLDMGLIIHGESGERLSLPNISIVSLNKGLLVYSGLEKEQGTPMVFLHEETIEEAIEILKKRSYNH